MTVIRHVFFDIGGVLATNGWDRTQRKAAVEQFGLDAADFQARHEQSLGMHTIHYQSPDQLRAALVALGIQLTPPKE